MPRINRLPVASVLLALFLSPLHAQEGYRPSAENLAARQWFQDARFGLFIHWGIYSLLQNGEWVMENTGIPLRPYEGLAAQFNPARFSAAEWVGLAKAAGMRYITVTAKHHDGFAMFDSKVSDWDLIDRSPFRRDVMAELAAECRRQGLKLFFYYSQVDWHHSDYYPRGRTGQRAGRPDRGEWSRYLDYMDAQLRELLTEYGPIGGIWFDGMWDKPEADWRLGTTYGLIHALQPAALLGSNHHKDPIPGEDFQMFEKDLPGGNTAGWNTAGIGSLPLETAETMNGSWGYSITDRRFKSSRELIRLLVGAAGRNANLLLNVGPMPTGEIQSELADTLRVIGRWMSRYGESIHGTRGGPIEPRPWGVSTQKGNRVYLHILDWLDPELALPPLPRPIRSASLLRDGRRVELRGSPSGTVLRLPPRDEGEPDQIVVIELAP